MPEICRFFGIVVRMYYDEHNPPHFHAEYSGNKAVFDFKGNVKVIYPQKPQQNFLENGLIFMRRNL